MGHTGGGGGGGGGGAFLAWASRGGGGIGGCWKEVGTAGGVLSRPFCLAIVGGWDLITTACIYTEL